MGVHRLLSDACDKENYREYSSPPEPLPYSRYAVSSPLPSTLPPPVLQSPLPPSPPSPHRHHVFSKSAMAMVVLVSTVLLFVSFYMMLVRWYQRRNPHRRAMHRQQPPPALDQFLDGEEPINYIWYINTVGLEESLINSITACKFRRGEGLVEETGCSVCLGEFQDGEDLRLLPKCSHAFHLQCIDKWLRAHVNCPLCRAAIFTNNLNSVSRENNNTGSSSVDVLHGAEPSYGRESSDDQSRNPDSLAVEIADVRNESEEGMANLDAFGVLAGQSIGNTSNRTTVEETTTEFQPVRRSVSMNSLPRIHVSMGLPTKSAREFSAVPCESMVAIGSSGCGKLNLGEKGGDKSERDVQGEIDKYPCLQKGPFDMKRSFSIGTNFLFSKRGRNGTLVLPL